MKIKSIVVLAVLATAILCSAGIVQAQTTPTYDQLTQQLIQLLEQLITQLQQEIAAILAQHPTSTTCTPNWTCGWGPCANGYQSQIAIDSNNCGQSSSSSNIACPALAQTCTSSAQPSITSITPTQGSSGTVVTIYGSNLSGASSVEFYAAGSQFMGSLAPSYVSSQYLTFTISGLFAANMAPGLYQVGVVTNACAGGCDSNRIGFTLTSSTTTPSITVTSPNGGEQWAEGSIHNITWTTSNISSSDKVDIMLLSYNTDINHPNGEVLTGGIAGGADLSISGVPANSGSYTWTVPSGSGDPSLLSGNYFKIQISARNSYVTDSSNNYFSIVAP